MYGESKIPSKWIVSESDIDIEIDIDIYICREPSCKYIYITSFSRFLSFALSRLFLLEVDKDNSPMGAESLQQCSMIVLKPRVNSEDNNDNTSKYEVSNSTIICLFICIIFIYLPYLLYVLFAGNITLP